jgi:glucose-6-phosphate 1-epimerase
MVSADIPDRLKRLEIPNRLAFLEGNGEMPKIQVTTDWSTAEIYLHGAQVTDFRKKDEPPLLFTSKFSRFENEKPIRGGIPIIFPWFGSREGEPMHGFARISPWDLHEATATPEGGVSLRFSLPETAESGIWPSFTANYAVTVTDQLQIELIVTNTSPDHDLVFENCLHTYFHVGDIHLTSLRGLKGASYLDKVEGFATTTESNDEIKITSEVDRIFPDAGGAVEIVDAKFQRAIRVEKCGSASTVVWNPWTHKSQQMPDFGFDEYLRMVCVESGNVAKNKITLAPGKSSVLSVTLSSQPLP